MAKITTAMIEKAYEQAKLVYFGQESQTLGQDNLEDFGLNRNSAGDLIVNFRCMMDGQKFTRTNNAETTKYYLENISKDYGKNRLANALSALEQHIDYYEDLQNTTMHKIRKIFEEFKSKVDFISEIVYPDEVSGNLTEGSKKEVTVNAYERNPIARKKCLEHYGFNCSVCDLNFEEVYGIIGKDFIHVHHLEQLSDIKKEYTVDPKIFEEFKSKVDFISEIVYPDEVSGNLTEGSKKEVTVNAYERNPIARKKCLEHYGFNCSVCDLNFEEVYGIIGKDFIHVHHLEQLSDIKKEYTVDPIKDLRPVCPNCHAMLHKRNPPYSIDELKDITNHWRPIKNPRAAF